MRIWKDPLELQEKAIIPMPKGAEVISVASQFNKACMWALVDPKAELEPREFKVAGTGLDIVHDVDVPLKFIGTFQLAEGRFIGHLFEIIGVEHGNAEDKG